MLDPFALVQVQSSTHSVEHVLQEVDAFLKDFAEANPEPDLSSACFRAIRSTAVEGPHMLASARNVSVSISASTKSKKSPEPRPFLDQGTTQQCPRKNITRSGIPR